MLDALGIDAAVVVGHDWGGPVAWHTRVAPPRPVRGRRRAERPLRWRRDSADPVVSSPPTPMRAALGDGFLYILYFQEPGVAERELDADLRRTLGAILYSISGDLPRDQFRFFDPSARSFVRRAARAAAVRSTGCRTSRSRRVRRVVPRTTARSPVASTGTATSTATRSCSPRSWAARSSNPRCSSAPSSTAIFGQTPEAVLATRSAVPNLRDPVWIAGSGHWIQQEEPEQVNAALLGFLRSLPGSAARAVLTASAETRERSAH